MWLPANDARIGADAKPLVGFVAEDVANCMVFRNAKQQDLRKHG